MNLFLASLLGAASSISIKPKNTEQTKLLPRLSDYHQTKKILFPTITLKIDDPIFLVSSLLNDISFDSEKVVHELLNGRWCQTLKTYDFPVNEDEDEYLLHKPIERICQRWRFCRDNLLSMSSCKALRKEKVYQVSMQVIGLYDDKYQCDSGLNTLSCLQQHCECDLDLSKSILNSVLDDVRYEQRYRLEVKTLRDSLGREVNVTVHK